MIVPNHIKKKVSVHNNFFQKVFSHLDLLIDLLENYVAKDIVDYIDMASMKSLNSRFFGDITDFGEADLSYLANFKNLPPESPYGGALVMLFLEHKYTWDPGALLQLHYYMAMGIFRFWNEHNRQNPLLHRLPCPVPIVFYHGEGKSWQPLRFKELYIYPKSYEKHVPDFEPIVIDLTTIDYNDIKGEPLTRAALEVLKRASDNTLKTHWPSFLRHFRGLDIKGRVYMMLKDCLTYIKIILGDLSKKIFIDAFKLIFGEKEGIDMSEFFIDDLLLEGEKKGEKKGKIEGKIESLMMILENKFGMLSKDIYTRIHQINDEVVLNSLTTSALQSKTKEEFLHDLN